MTTHWFNDASPKISALPGKAERAYPESAALSPASLAR
jgi:hypothetical protein